MSKSLITDKRGIIGYPVYTAFFMAIFSGFAIYLSYYSALYISRFTYMIMPLKVALVVFVPVALSFILTCLLQFKFKKRIFLGLFCVVCLAVSIMMVHAIYQWLLSISVIIPQKNIFYYFSRNIDEVYFVVKYNKMFFTLNAIIVLFGLYPVIEILYFIFGTDKKSEAKNEK